MAEPQRISEAIDAGQGEEEVTRPKDHDGGDWLPGDPYPTGPVPPEVAPMHDLKKHPEAHTYYDGIKRPEHYARFAIEPCTFIMTNELPYWAGNVIKYVCRAPYKHDSEEQDIKKAIRYCEMRLEQLKREKEGTTGRIVKRPL